MSLPVLDIQVSVSKAQVRPQDGQLPVPCRQASQSSMNVWQHGSMWQYVAVCGSMWQCG